MWFSVVSGEELGEVVDKVFGSGFAGLLREGVQLLQTEREDKSVPNHVIYSSTHHINFSRDHYCSSSQ